MMSGLGAYRRSEREAGVCCCKKLPLLSFTADLLGPCSSKFFEVIGQAELCPSGVESGQERVSNEECSLNL